MACRCNDVDELHGPEAEEYAREHLVGDEVSTDRFEERLSCPDTGRRWILEWPERTEREPGQARLRLAG